MMKQIGKWFFDHWPSFTISKDGIPYLTRFYVLLRDWVYGNIFVHFFHRSDMDMGVNGLGLLHNHPFRWSVSFIIAGGYREERRDLNGVVYTRLVKPFTFNFISNDVFHRVDLLDEKKGCWSIFITGSRKDSSWGFWDRTTNVFTPWKEVEGAIE
jgi:hypothetical protein